MDEYEVELRDYWVVIWQRKWIIGGVFVAAIVIALIYSYSLPNQYRAEALARFRPSPSMGQLHLEDLPSVATVAELLQQDSLWRVAANRAPNDVEPLDREADEMGGYLARGFQAQVMGDSTYLQLKLERPTAPTSLQAWLSVFLSVAQETIREPIRADIQAQIHSLNERQRILRQQHRGLQNDMANWIDRRVTNLQDQRDDLRQRLDELLSNPGGQGEPGDVVQGNILQQAYATLTSQLQAVESEIVRLQTERQSSYPRPGSGLDGQLNQVQNAMSDLDMEIELHEKALAMDWSPLRVVSEPSAGRGAVGPNRKLNIVIAGILGLFVGLLLAFFVHYLQSEPVAAREQSTGPVEADS